MWRDSVVRYAEAAWMHWMLSVPQLLWCVSGFKPFHIIWPLGFNNSRCLHCVRLTHFWIELIVQKTRLARLKIKSLRQFSLDETSTGHDLCAWVTVCMIVSDLWPLQVPQLLPARRSSATRSVPLARWPEYSLCSGMKTWEKHILYVLPSSVLHYKTRKRIFKAAILKIDVWAIS